MNSPLNRRILLGVTGGIAAYKSVELVRRLRERGADVRVMMTRAAQAFVTPLTFQAVSGQPVATELLDAGTDAAMDHIALARWAEAILIAPASADFLARLTAGMADDLPTAVCLASAAPLAVAPAMNRQMWAAPATQANIATLTRRGTTLFGPAVGEQACGETGAGRMLEPLELVERLTSLFSKGALAGVRVLVTAGPTREALDPVRYLSNHSSGKMGFAVAAAAAEAGAAVTLISGPVTLATPPGVERIDVVSALEMAEAVAARSCDLFIGTAAVADFRPATPAAGKIKKGDAGTMQLELVRNPDILATVAARDERPFTVGFAAETGHLATEARSKLERKRLDLIAANDVSADAAGGFHSDQNALTLFWPGGGTELPLQDKTTLARALIDVIARRYHRNRQEAGEA